MLTDEDRQHILKLFLGNIAGIADKEYQKRVWIRGEGPECDDFTETCCEFFPVAEDVLKNYKQFNVTEIQRDILQKFYNDFSVFADDNNWPELFINTTEWAQIMEIAKEVLKTFNHPTNRNQG